MEISLKKNSNFRQRHRSENIFLQLSQLAKQLKMEKNSFLPLKNTCSFLNCTFKKFKNKEKKQTTLNFFVILLLKRFALQKESYDGDLRFARKHLQLSYLFISSTEPQCNRYLKCGTALSQIFQLKIQSFPQRVKKLLNENLILDAIVSLL